MRTPARTAKVALWSGLAAGLGAALLVSGCLVDMDSRCGANQHFDADSKVCLCDADFARVGDSCARCGENETGSADGCVCVEGYSRSAAGAPCAPAASLGQDCAKDDDCSEQYPHCALEAGAGTGYCTLASCSNFSDCPTDYGCNTRSKPSYCERPPEGLGTACDDPQDCTGFAAAYCETVSAHACLVNDCAPDPDKCHGDWVCCDIGLLQQSLCIPPNELEDGNCPVGGTLIPRTK